MATIPDPIDRRHETYVNEQGQVERTDEIIRDTGVEHQLLVERLVSLVWLVAFVLESLFGLRFVLKLLAANPDAGFSRFVYSSTAVFLQPFQGLTVTPSAGGMVLELTTLIAMLVYLIAFWVVMELVRLVLGYSRVRTVSTFERRGRF
jgi:YggT family protein